MTTETKLDLKAKALLYENLSYRIIGILIEAHKELGPYAREKQVGDLIKKKITYNKISFQREIQIGDTGNIIDFVIENKLILELKTVPILNRRAL